jgi:hypothetical protein
MMRMAIQEKRKKKKEKTIKIPRGYYSDLKYWLEIDITGEAVDVRIKAANLQMALQAITLILLY